MSARVCIERYRGSVTVPRANHCEIKDDGNLHLFTSSWSGTRVGIFTNWDYVVIEPDRGPNGKFVKKD